MKSLIRVDILEQKENAKLCTENCGVDWLSPQPQQEATERLRHIYRDSVQIHFLDLGNLQVRQEHGQWLKRVEEEGLLLPLLVIDGEVRISGFFDMRMLLDMIEAERELGRG